MQNPDKPAYDQSTLQLHSYDVDVSHPPLHAANFRDGFTMEFALGDLHGSVPKLTFFWATIQVIQLPENLYRQLLEIYLHLFQVLFPVDNDKDNTLKKESVEPCLTAYKSILENIRVEISDARISVLLGDILYERGCLDYLTLLEIEHVRRIREQHQKRQHVIIIGNHDLEFICIMERKKRFDDEPFYYNASRSASALQRLLDAGIVEMQELKMLYSGFISQCQVIHYNVDPSGCLTGIFSHAGINMRDIVLITEGLTKYAHSGFAFLFKDHKDRLSKAYQVFTDAEKENKIVSAHIIALVDVINDLAAYHLKEGTYNELAQLGGPRGNVRKGQAGDIGTYPFHLLAWRRLAVAPNDVILSDLPSNTFPVYVHGHDPNKCHPEDGVTKVLKMDNDLCKHHDGGTHNSGGPKGLLTFTSTPWYPVSKSDLDSRKHFF